MPIFVGADELDYNGLTVGGAPVQQVYVGTDLVWANAPEPGFSQPNPNVQADWNPWTNVGNIGNFINAGYLRAAMQAAYTNPYLTREVAVTPGKEYIFELSGSSVFAAASRRMRVGSVQGSTDLGTLVVGNTSWFGDHSITFTPVTSTVWVAVGFEGAVSFMNLDFTSPRCEPT